MVVAPPSLERGSRFWGRLSKTGKHRSVVNLKKGVIHDQGHSDNIFFYLSTMG